jgi:hypothetical protein
MTRTSVYRATALILSITITLVIVEALLRLLDKPRPIISGWKTSEINPALSQSEMNQLGFRGQRIEYTNNDFVIVLLGDSQVEAVACGYEWMPERRLENYLNSSGRRVRVFTVGASGYGQDQELLALREYFQKFRANLVILWETPINDLWNNQFPTTIDGHAKPTFWLEEGRLKGPTEELGQQVRETPRFKLAGLVSRNVIRFREEEWTKYFPPAYTPLTEFPGPVKDDWQQMWNHSHESRLANLGEERTPLAMYLTPRSNRTLYGLDLTRKLLEEVGRLVSSHGGAFAIVATTTDFLQSSPVEESIFEGVHSLNGKYYQTSQNQYRDNLKYMHQGFDFYLIPITIEQYKVGPENRHLNEHATDQVMKDLAIRMESLVLPSR